jgi:hypothetical protein
MHLSWMHCRHDGNEIDLLHDRLPGARVWIGLNSERFAEISVPADQVAGELYSSAAQIHPGRSRLKVFAHEGRGEEDPTIIFNGLITAPRSEGDYVSLRAVCPSLRLQNATPAPLQERGVGSRLEISEPPGTALWKLIYHSNRRARELQEDPDFEDVPGLGIKKGSIDPEAGDSKLIRPAGGAVTWDLLVEHAERQAFPDFELEPLDTRAERDEDGAGEIHAQLNTYYPEQGQEREDVIFEEGINASAIAHAPDVSELCNRFILTLPAQDDTGIAPCIVAENRSSMKTFGVWQREESAGGGRGEDEEIVDVERVTARAERYVLEHSRHADRMEIRPYIEIGGMLRGWERDARGELIVSDEALALDGTGRPPIFLPGDRGDYWIGDTIEARSKRFRFKVGRGQQGPRADYGVRVLAGEYVEVDQAHNVGVGIEVEPTDDEATAVISYESEIFT